MNDRSMRPSKRWLCLAEEADTTDGGLNLLQKSEMPSDVLVGDSEHI